MLRRWLAAGAAVGCVFLAAAPAFALPHTIAINDPSGGQNAWQGFGQLCTPCSATLNFDINAGSGPTNQIYIYDTGLITVGSPFPGGSVPTLTPDLSGLTETVAVSPTTTTNFFALYYDTDPSISPNYAQYYFTPTEDDIFFSEPDYNGIPDNAFVALQLTPISGARGSFSAAWSYENDSFTSLGFPDDYTLGYPLSGYQVQGGANSNFLLGDQDYVNFSYPLTGTPEPSTWIELIAGLLGVGFVLRRRGVRGAAMA